jgi:hypothetical protein
VARRVGEAVSPGRPVRPAEAELPEVSPPIVGEEDETGQLVIRPTWSAAKTWQAVYPTAYTVQGQTVDTQLTANFTIPAGAFPGDEYEIYAEGDGRIGASGGRQGFYIGLQVGAAVDAEAHFNFDTFPLDAGVSWWAKGTVTIITEDTANNAIMCLSGVIGQHYATHNLAPAVYPFTEIPNAGWVAPSTPATPRRTFNRVQSNIFRLVARYDPNSGATARLTSYRTLLTYRGATWRP